MDDFYQRIGRAAVDLTGGKSRKLLLYSEVEDGVISASLFFQKRPIVRFMQAKSNSIVHFRFVSEELQNLIYEFWESGSPGVRPRAWSAMQFLALDEKFTANFM
jgi:hypothetical protein